MAHFQDNDWVQITPTADSKWSRAASDKTYYNNFWGKVGQISYSSPDDERQGEFIYKISVAFPHQIKNGDLLMEPGTYYAWFRGEHLMKSSKYEADRIKRQLEAGLELQKWEAFKKAATDKALRSVFGPEERTIVSPTKVEDDWEDKTPVQSIDDFYHFYYDDS